MPAPIALFAYNRPRHLARVLEGLRANPEAAASELHAFSDAPRDAAAAPAVAEVRALLRAAAGFASVRVIERKANLGLAGSIIDGVGALLAAHDRVVVLEDDLLPAPGFLGYMNEALEAYRDDPRVASVHAYCYPVREALPETFFLRGADCWGWGTWARAWRGFEADGARLLAELEQHGLTRAFDLDGAYPYTQMLRDQIAGRNDSWAVRWHAAAFLRGQLTLYPGCSQVQNIGADGSGTNLGPGDAFRHERWGEAVRIGGIPIEESDVARRAFATFLRSAGQSLPRRLLARVLGS